MLSNDFAFNYLLIIEDNSGNVMRICKVIVYLPRYDTGNIISWIIPYTKFCNSPSSVIPSVRISFYVLVSFNKSSNLRNLCIG